MDKKLICFFIDSLYRSAGTERIATDVANSLERRGYSICFLLLDSNTESFFSLNSKIQIYSLQCSYSQKVESILKLRKWVKSHKPNFIINVGIPMAMISIFACAFLSCKVVNWEHFYLKAGSKLGYIMRILAALLGYRQIVLTVSDKMSYPFFIRNKIECIPNFTTINQENNRSYLTSKTVLSIGRLNHAKGFDILIEAWKYVSLAHPDWKLRIIGNGKDRCTLNEMICKYRLSDSVNLLYPTNNVLDFYLSSSVYILPSRSEPFGLVLIEAKSCGLPIIAFDCPLGPKNIVRNYVDGLLVKPKSVKDLANAINYLLESKSKREDFGKAAFADYKEHWSEDIAMLKWSDILD